MSHATKSAKRVKPARSIRLALRPSGANPGVVTITVGKEAADYFLTEVPADFGRGFPVEKVGGEEVYHVNLDGNGKACECKGFTRWGRCKHADGLAALVQHGTL
jgi:hypothetical protein